MSQQTKSLILLLASIGLLLPAGIQAAEWFTSRGEHCIDRCSPTRHEGDYEGDVHPFTWCHTADPDHTVLDPAVQEEEGDDGQGPNTFGRWDYCTPLSIEDTNDLNGTERDFDGKPSYVEMTTAMSALYPEVECDGPCLINGKSAKCAINANETIDGREEFYCAKNMPMQRSQLSSLYGLWCTDECRRGQRGNYFCSTLFGADFCSPTPDVSYKNRPCFSPCTAHINNQIPQTNETEQGEISAVEYSCFTSDQNTTWEHCGLTVEQNEAPALEFTVDGAVCADPCKWTDEEAMEYKWCKTVFWRPKQEQVYMDEHEEEGHDHDEGGHDHSKRDAEDEDYPEVVSEETMADSEHTMADSVVHVHDIEPSDYAGDTFQTEVTSELVLTWGYCESFAPAPDPASEPNHATAGIAVGIFIGVVLLLFLLAYVPHWYNKRKMKAAYKATRTQEAEFIT